MKTVLMGSVVFSALVGAVGVSHGAASQMSTAVDHACAITGSGALYCWGNNANGQLGDGTTTTRNAPTAVSSMTSNVTDVSTGQKTTCAINNGAAYCWGDNTYGQMGNGTTTNSTTPQAVSGLTSGVTQIATGADFACAIASSTLYCWGHNTYGQLGVGSTTDYHTPQAVSMPSSTTPVSVALSSNAYSACVIATLSSNKNLYCWGYNTDYNLGLGDSTNRNVPSGPLSFVRSGSTYSGSVTEASLGDSHGCAIAGTYPFCWGRNAKGQLGDGTTTDNASPTPVTVSTNVGWHIGRQLGSRHSCASRNTITSYSGWSWGDNGNGQLGNNTIVDSDVPVSNHYLPPPPPVRTVYHESCGGDFSCGVYDGTPYCFGENNYGQLGTGDYTQYQIPTPVAGSVTW